MNIRPLKRYGKPQYPTKLEAMRHPDLLSAHVPPAWRKHAEMAGVVALLLSANGCTESSSDAPIRKPLETANVAGVQDAASSAGDIGNAESDSVAGAVAGRANRIDAVAPVFAHGEGRGVTGCIVVAPPAFLSEEEAVQVIAEQLGRAGIKVVVSNGEQGQTNGPAKVDPVEPDGFSEDRRIAFEFVSSSDYFALGGKRSRMTVQDYDLKQRAEAWAARVAEQKTQGCFGTFYDPMQKVDSSRESTPDGALRGIREKTAAAREQSKQLLREQVVDFVNWLKAQGAI